MSDLKIKKVLIWSKQILLSFVDFNDEIMPILDQSNTIRIPLKEYKDSLPKKNLRFSQEFYRLQKQGFIKKYYNGKEMLLELSEKGKLRLRKIITDGIQVSYPEKWDKKWRLIIFDIPRIQNVERNIFRAKIEEIGFIKIQESAYVFPFDCLSEINLIKDMYNIRPCIQYIVAERIETEVDLIQKFLKNKILLTKMLD